MKILLKKEWQGQILDLGGGGEGVIGRLYGPQVIAIDNRQEELDEAPDGFEKRLMDAAALDFRDCCFDHVTSFFTMMFLEKDTREKAISEAARVLRPGGSLHIWDAAIEHAWPQPFLAELDIDLDGTPLHTTYGILQKDGDLSAESLSVLCRAAGLRETVRQESGGNFYLHFIK